MPDAILLLLVEDEPLILLATQDALEAGGYTVVTASTAADAVAILDDRHSEIAGVITDVKLGGGADGWAVARHARELRLDMPIVYATGDSARQWPILGVPKSVVVQKPYAEAQVLTAISTVLNQADDLN